MAMRRIHGRTLTLDTALAVLLVLLLSGQVLAAAWQGPMPVSTRGRATASTGVAVVGKTIHLGFEEAWGGVRHAVYRRSVDGGLTLGSRLTLSGAKAEWAAEVDVAASGSSVDAVWIEAALGSTGLPADPWTLRYRRSANAGVSWGPTLTLGSGVGYPRVDRAGSIVIVTWTNVSTGKVWLRRSTDGGVTFAAAAQVGTTTNLIEDGVREGFASVAFGTAITYLVLMPTWPTVVVRRSTDGGRTWGSPTTLATNASGWGPQIAATGSRALVSYASWDGKAVTPAVRVTMDKGSHWAQPAPLAGTAAPDDFQPVIGVSPTGWYAAFESCTTTCATSRVVFRSSANGTTWTTAEVVSTGSRTFNTPVGVVHAGVPVIVWYDIGGSPTESDVLLRRKG